MLKYKILAVLSKPTYHLQTKFLFLIDVVAFIRRPQNDDDHARKAHPKAPFGKNNHKTQNKRQKVYESESIW
jgi:hypothetical protein